MSTQIIAALAAVGLIGAGVAGAAETRSIDAIPGAITMMGAGLSDATGNKCRVDVIRSGTPGAADVVRQVLNNGQCVCTVTTGNVKANGSAEDIVKALLRDRTCDSAPLAEATTAQAGVTPAAATTAASGGGSGIILPVVIGVAGAAGLVAAAGKDSKG